ncbi:MAG: hypothetical protein ACI8Z1_000088 [Candidatus Azotimanducaceae bacterium]|jgi:hypothetical protein
MQTRRSNPITNLRPTRRNVLKFAAGAALIPLLPGSVYAADKVPTSDPTALALRYVEDTAEAVGKTDKMGVAAADQRCDNCRFYVASAEAGWGPCALFQNRLVAGPGWCAGWVPSA